MSSIILQQSRKLYTIRNIGKRATRKAVMGAKPLEVGFLSPTVRSVTARFQMENTHLPSYANMEPDAELQQALPRILAGKDPRWKMWEGEIYTDRLILHFVDMNNTAATRTKNTDLSCFMFWNQDVDMIITTPDQTIVPGYYHLWITTTQDNEGYLHVAYPSGLTTPDGVPLVCDETYGIHLLRE